MSSKKDKEPKGTFTSFRIIGEKAQKLLRRAREMNRKELVDRSPAVLPSSAAPEQEVLVHLSLRSVIKATFAVLAVACGVFLVYLLQDKIVLFFLALFVAAILDPGVKAMKRAGIPRGIGILIHYFVGLALLLFLLISLIPILADQIIEIARLISDQANIFLANPRIELPLITAEANLKLTALVQSSLQQLSITQFTDALQQFGQSMATTAQGGLLLAAHFAGSLLNFFFNLVLVLVLAFFLQIEKEHLTGWLRGFVPWHLRPYLDDKSEVIHFKLGQWARGQLVLCLAIGFLVYLALVILRMPYALTLGILAGFTEFIPYIGPFIAAVPAILIGMTQHGLLWGLVIAGVYYIVQWCENNLLVPLIMKRAVGLSATSILFAMLVGVSFPQIIHPVLGIVLSIPVTTIIVLFLEDWRNLRTGRVRVEE
ncbi:MAG: hypothetical protein Greene041619_1052 [Candidatus Peregrinibacteria bacterium Greene0416_19]|nr:MAG: hypothetical protein Greene041619_1052 [Candidatus Peregrinibacteria bacterium Greene0416_19]